MRYRKIFVMAIWVIFVTSTFSYASQESGLQIPEKSVFLVETIHQQYNYRTPWKLESMAQSSGTCFVISQ